MAEHIPFVNTQRDCQILGKYYKDSHIIRVSLESISKIKANLPRNISLWIDPAIDGYDHHLKKHSNPIPTYLRNFAEYQILQSVDFNKKPDSQKVHTFVNSVLNTCSQLKPEWITVPQLPFVDNTSRNKINSSLAKATNQWKIKNNFKGKLILPLIFTNQQQLITKTKWRPRLDSAINWYENSNADGAWVVDSSLSDQLGTETFRQRFRALIGIHEYLRTSLREAIILSGPYWAMNLVIWAKGLCDYPNVCLGSAYQYHISGASFRRTGKTRVAIPPLKRCAIVSPELRSWLDDALKRLNTKDQAFKELQDLRSNYQVLSGTASREQIARFYKIWFDKMDQTPPAGRSLALYQEFSSAYVLGKQLPMLPASGNSARKPEKVAELYMLNCL